MPIGYERSREVPSARPKRELAPSATTTIRARTGLGDPALGRGGSPRPVTSPPSTSGSTASLAGQRVAPAFTARSGHHLVEVPAAHDVPEVREVGMLRPAQLERDAVGHRAQALVALELLELVGRGPSRAAGAPPGGSARRRRSSPGGSASCRRRAREWPCCASQYAADAPAGPAPTTSASQRALSIRRIVARATPAPHPDAARRLGVVLLRCVAAPSSVVEKQPTEGLQGAQPWGAAPAADGGPKGRCPTCCPTGTSSGRQAV